MTRPPRLARLLLHRLALPDDRPFIVDDLDEEFMDRVKDRGPFSTRAWYVSQVMLSLPSLVRLRLSHRDPHRIRTPMFPDFGSDLRDALRRARRNPLSAAAIILISALGIGASTAVYTVVHAVLMTPLPFAGSERVVRIENMVPRLANEASYLPSDTWTDFLAWRERARSFEVLAGLWEGGTMRAFTLAEETTSLPVAIVTEGFDNLLGVRPLIGRSFVVDEYRFGGPHVMALSEQMWRTRFGADSGVVGRTIVVSDAPRLVVGVFPDANDFPGPVAAWIPLAPVPETSMARGRMSFLALHGRLRPGVTVDQARAEMQSLIAETATTDAQRERVARVTLLSEKLTGPVRPVLLLLTAVVAVTLLVAAGNVALLLLAQAEARSRELSIRLSLGSALSRLARKLAVESVLLAGIGGALGLLLAKVLVSKLVAFYPGRLARADDISIGPPVMLVAAAMTIVVGLVAAWPLLRRLRSADLATGLREGTVSASPAALRVRRTLMIGQLAFAVAMVTSGGMLVRTFVNLLRVNPGFDATGVGYISVSSSVVRYPDRAVLLGRLQRAQEVVRGLPGVTEVASVTYLPLPSRIIGYGTRMMRADDPAQREYSIQFRHMSPEYVDVMRIPVRQGRSLTASDDATGADVALINETLARSAFPAGNALGRAITVQSRTYTVVGILGDMKYWGLAQPVIGEVYVSASQSSLSFRSIVFKSTVDPAIVGAAARAAIRAADETIVVSQSGRLADRVAAASAPERFRALLVGSLAILAFILAGFGLYAVSAHAVAMRSREIGIRVALGATGGRVRRSVLRDTFVLGASGTAIGLALAWAASRGLTAFLTDVSGFDLMIGGTAAGLFLVLSLIAAALPAVRASRVDPLIAMRSE